VVFGHTRSSKCGRGSRSNDTSSDATEINGTVVFCRRDEIA